MMHRKIRQKKQTPIKIVTQRERPNMTDSSLDVVELDATVLVSSS